MKREIYATDGTLTICPAFEKDKRNMSNSLARKVDKLIKILSKIGIEIKISVSDDGIYYSIFDEKNDYCGYFVINNPLSSTPEIGIELIKAKRNKGIALRATRLVAKRFYEEHNVEYFLIKIQTENNHSRHVIEKSGAIFCGMDKEQSNQLIDSFIEALNDTDNENLKKAINKEMLEHEIQMDEVYVYKFMPELFL